MSCVTEIDLRIGQRLFAARQLRGVSEDALARKLGTTPAEIQDYEKGRCALPAARLHDIARALELNESFFFDGLNGSTPCPYSLSEEHYAGLRRAVQRIAADHEATANGLRKKLALRDAIRIAQEVCSMFGWRYSRPSGEGPDFVAASQGAQHDVRAVKAL